MEDIRKKEQNEHRRKESQDMGKIKEELKEGHQGKAWGTLGKN